jgi:hypothetical protein
LDTLIEAPLDEADVLVCRHEVPPSLQITGPTMDKDHLAHARKGSPDFV